MDNRDINLAYAAGFIDADGCIIIEKSKKNREFGIQHTPRICGYNNDTRPLKVLKALFGGQIRVVKRKNAPSHYKTTYYWQISGYRAIQAARELMPFLQRKSLQAYVLSCFDYEKLWSKGGIDVKMPLEEFYRREELTKEIRSYNREIA